MNRSVTEQRDIEQILFSPSYFVRKKKSPTVHYLWYPVVPSYVHIVFIFRVRFV